MKIALISPPMGCLSHSGAALPYLAAALRAEGHEVTQRDLGIKVIDELLSFKYLAKTQETIEEKFAGLSKTKRLSKKERRHRDLLTVARAYAPAVVPAIEDAKNALRDPDRFYRPDEYVRAANTVRRAFDMVSAAFFPSWITSVSCGFPGVLSLANIYNLGPDPLVNPFYGPMRKCMSELLSSQDCRLVGISLTYEHQMVPAFLAARLVKELCPGAHVVIGGATATLSEPRIVGNRDAFRYVDSYVFGEGEGTVTALAKAVAEGAPPPAGLRNLCSKDAPARDAGRAFDRTDFNRLPGPDYSGLNLEDYLSPEPVFLVTNARGCYWRKCAFCDVAPAFANFFEQRKAELLRQDLKTLAGSLNARNFFFSDEAIPPPRCGEIAGIMSSLGGEMNWQTYARYEKGFDTERLSAMAASGCRLLSFGNESGCQRVLDLMRKGTRVEQSKRIIERVHAAGIAVGLQSFVGFPTETFEEAMHTVDTIINMKEWVTTSGMNLFGLMERSPVAAHPEEFGVSDIRRTNRGALVPHYTFKTSAGMDRKEAGSAYKIAGRKTYDAFPAQYIFLDGGFGGHLLLYLGHHRETDLEKVFFRPPDKKTFMESRPRLKASVEVIALSGRSAVLFNREDLRVVAVEAAARAVAARLDGKRTVHEIVREAIASSQKPEQMPVFMTTLLTLLRENMIEMLPES